MKKYAIVKKIDDNSSCPAAHLVECRLTYGRRGIVEYYDTLEEANKTLFGVATESEDQDPASCPALWAARSWPLFCANVARLGTCNTRACTDADGCRYYHDSDMEAFQVVPVIMDEEGHDVDPGETMAQC